MKDSVDESFSSSIHIKTIESYLKFIMIHGQLNVKGASVKSTLISGSTNYRFKEVINVISEIHFFTFTMVDWMKDNVNESSSSSTHFEDNRFRKWN